MNTKKELLKILEQNRGKSVSGEELAGQLGVSRSSIWKSVNVLRSEGYQIDAGTNRGYVLNADSDMISAEGIEAILDGDGKMFNITVLDDTDSTNLEVRRLAAAGAPAGTVVIANAQTAGRGRLGRSFYSPQGGGIYLSVLLKPPFNVQQAVLITTAVSVAVCRAIERSTGKSPGIKWVNDVFLNGKKVCGISTEAVSDFESGNVEYVIIGIGINCTPSDLPDELKEIVGFVLDEGEKISRNKIAAELIRELENLEDSIVRGSFIDEYRTRSVVIGKEIKIISGGKTENGKAVDIDDRGGLIVETESGETRTLCSGEISIRLAKNN